MSKNILLLFFQLLIYVSVTYAQSVDDNLVKLADEMYGFGDKKDALQVYLQAIEMNADNAYANYMAGKCYLETVDKQLSVTYLVKAYTLNKKISPDIMYKIGQGYQFGAKFDDAIKNYKQYKDELTDEKAKKLSTNLKDEILKTDKRISECINGKEYLAKIKFYRIENVKDVVNSEYPDYSPAITADQNMMIFTSRRSGGVGKNKDVDNEYFEDVWVTKKNAEGQWLAPENIGTPINSETHDASIGLSKDGKILYLYKPDNGGDIYVSKLLPDGKWSVPENLGGKINSKFNEPSVSISNDEKTLYFSSNRPGGFGEMDIYTSTLDDKGKWGKPQNIGSTINTEYDEDSPYIDADGKTLYFSSRGNKGMGGYDIYKTVYNDTTKMWSTPENMGYPVNSPDDDIYFVIAGDGKTGYYSSAKGDGFGDKDIYKIYLRPEKNIVKDSATTQPLNDTTAKLVPKDTLKPIVKKDTIITPVAVKKDTTSAPIAKSDTTAPKPVAVQKPPVKDTVANITTPQAPEPKPAPVLLPTIVKGRIYDQKTGNSISAKLSIIDSKGNVIQEISIDESGNYSTQISTPKNTKYGFNITKDGYLYSNTPIPISSDAATQKTLKRDFALKKVQLGEVFILRNIYFEFDKANIKKESFPYLDKLVNWLNKNPTIELEVGGHTDNAGLDSYNKILSQKRVNAVKLYLQAKGINPNRLTAVGYGEERPLASNDDELEGREINRRTEFKIVKH